MVVNSDPISSSEAFHDTTAFEHASVAITQSTIHLLDTPSVTNGVVVDHRRTMIRIQVPFSYVVAMDSADLEDECSL